MAETTLLINLSRSSDGGGFGFSLLGKFAGIPHVIYDVIEDSPAAECEVSSKTSRENSSSEASSLFFGETNSLDGRIDTVTHVVEPMLDSFTRRPLSRLDVVQSSEVLCIVVFVFLLALFSLEQRHRKKF